MRVRDELNDEGLAAFRAGMAEAGASPEQVDAALDADQPDGGALAATQAFAGHAKVQGSHTHAHSAYGHQGSTTRVGLGAISRELASRGVTDLVALLAES